MGEEKMKELDSRKLGPFIIANSIVWGIVIVTSSIILRNTGLMPRLIPILSAGAATCVIFLPLMLVKKKDKDQ